MSAAFKFGRLMAARVKTAGIPEDVKNLGSQMWNNSARAFKGLTGTLGAGAGTAISGAAGLGMQAINAPAQAYNALGHGVNYMTGRPTMSKINPVFSPSTVNAAYGAMNNYANVGNAYGQDFMNSVGLGPQGFAGTTQSGSLGDAAWKNLEQQPGVSAFSQDISGRARNVVDTAANVAPAAAIGNIGQIAKPFQAASAAAPAQTAATASRLPSVFRPVVRAAKGVQTAYGTTNNAASGAKLVNSALSSGR